MYEIRQSSYMVQKVSKPLQHSGYYILQPALESQGHRILSTHDGCKFHVILNNSSDYLTK